MLPQSTFCVDCFARNVAIIIFIRKKMELTERNSAREINNPTKDFRSYARRKYPFEQPLNYVDVLVHRAP